MNAWSILQVVAICVLLLIGGCTGQQLAPGGTITIKLDLSPEGAITGFLIESNKDASFDLLTIDPKTKAVTIKGYEANGSSLAAIQAKASMAQIAEIGKGTAAALDALKATLPLLTKAAPVVAPVAVPVP